MDRTPRILVRFVLGPALGAWMFSGGAAVAPNFAGEPSPAVENSPPVLATADRLKNALEAMPSDASQDAASLTPESEPLHPRGVDRTPQMDAAARHAKDLDRAGFDLARRGAIYSARANFMDALRTVAAALDDQQGGNDRQRMLAAGLQALHEADDFADSSVRLEDDVNLAQIVSGHKTPLLKSDLLAGCTPKAALGLYLTYAQEQLAAAVNDVPSGSAALYGLGRIYSVPPEAHGPADSMCGAKAVVFYQAALLADGQNSLAANELGVAFVQFGRLSEARSAFQYSLSVVSLPTVWQNLAQVHRSLGEAQLAERATIAGNKAADRLSRAHAAASQSTYGVQWVDQATFVRQTPLNVDAMPGVNTGNSGGQAKRIANGQGSGNGS